MPYLCDYHVVKDGPVHLGHGEERTFDFNPPNDIVLDGSRNKPIASFRVRPNGPVGGRVKMSIIQNGQTATVLERNVDGGSVIQFNEVVNQEIITGSNTIEFSNGGVGEIKVSDVVMWFKRDITV